jgi:hypothetical protein
MGIRHADNVAPSIRKKLALTSPTSGVRSVGIVRSRTQATELSFSSEIIRITLQCSWLRQCATSQKLAGPISGVNKFFNLSNPSSPVMALESTQPPNCNQYHQFSWG